MLSVSLKKYITSYRLSLSYFLPRFDFRLIHNELTAYQTAKNIETRRAAAHLCINMPKGGNGGGAVKACYSTRQKPSYGTYGHDFGDETALIADRLNEYMLNIIAG